MSLAKKLIPLLDRVLVEKIVPPAKSVGGVLLPESATQKILQGLVISTGKGRHSNNGQVIPVSVQAGDKVLLPEYGGMPVKLDDKEYIMYRDDELLGVMKD